MGDINIDMLKMNQVPSVDRFMCQLFSSSLYPLIPKPTRIINRCATLIDNILTISIITQVIIEILVISLVEDYVISCYNHLTRGDYSGSTNFQTAAGRFVVSEEEISTMKENAIPKGFKDAAKSGVKLFEDRIWKIC